MAASMEDEADLVDLDDYYAWLGLSKDASKEEINNAFRKLSRIYHPDKHASNANMKDKAENMFTKIKKAHEVLSDPQKRAIYDTMGLKGLETEGWEVVTRTKTPQEILQEYERLAQEREERKLEQKTNPKGTITVGIDATDMFDYYEAMDVIDYHHRRTFPRLEVSQMSISQSVECPLTVKDTTVLSGSLTTQNGTGGGAVGGTYRRVLSHKAWAEMEVSAGSGTTFAFRGFRTLWHRGFGTLSGTFQFTPNGLRPSTSAMVATQLDKNVQGRLTFSLSPSSSAMNSMIVRDTQTSHFSFGLQLGLPNTYLAMNYAQKFGEKDFKIKGGLRLGTFGAVLEYGCEKRITQFSILGASMVVGVPVGVTLKIKVNRGSQNFMFPIHLADEIVPSAVFYGTVMPIIVYITVQKLFVSPFLKNAKEKEIEKKREANAERMAEKRTEAGAAIELMRVSVDRSYEVEEKKGGLLIKKALFGKLEGEDLRDTECVTVTIQLQSLVKDSKLYIPEGTQLSELPGFYDPSPGEEKELSISYEFRRRLHMCRFNEKQKVLIPNREHVCETQPPANDDQ